MKVALLALLAYAGAAAAATVTFLPPCADWVIRQAGADVQLRCRSTQALWMTVKDCPQAAAKRDLRTGDTRIQCANGNQTVIGR